MAYDARIILGGQGPDVMGAIASGDEAAARTNALRQSQALSELYKTKGGDIMAGDQNALRALAGIDPNAAMSVQGAQLGMDATRQNMSIQNEEMQMKREAIKQAAAQHAATLSAEQRAAEAANIERGIKAASTATTPEQWDAIATQFGANDLVGQFEMRDALLAQYADIADVLKGGGSDVPAGVQTLEWRAQQAGLVPGTPEYQKFMLEGDAPKQSGMVVYGPDGNPILTTGGAQPKPFTEAQGKDVGFATRAEGANAELETGATALTNLGETAANAIPFGLGKFAQSDKYKLATGAGQEFLTAFLRKDSGAAITPDETAMYGEMFLPRPGDGDAVIAQKAERRKRAIAAIKAGMSPDQIAAQERALGATGGAATPAPEMTDEDLLRKYGG